MKKIILQGKVWEIRQLLKQNGKRFYYVADWIQTMEDPKKGKTAGYHDKVIRFRPTRLYHSRFVRD